MQLEPARIESLLDTGWSLISQLRQWFSAWSLGSTDPEGLVDLIRSPQLFWVKADDLGLKRLARNSLALEQFLERYCAGKLELTTEILNDVTAAVGSLQDLLLGFEAMREEPIANDLALLQKLERDTLPGFLSAAAKKTIDVTVVASVPQRQMTTVNHHPNQPELHSRDLHLETVSKTALLGLNPAIGDTLTASEDTSSPSVSAAWPMAMRHIISVKEFQVAPELIDVSNDALANEVPDAIELDSAVVPEPVQEALEFRRVLIVENSLFYRNLIGMALRSVGYDSDSIQSDSNAFEAVQNERSLEYCAILVGEPVTTEVADAIVRYRTANGTPVIRLMTSDSDETFPFIADESVSKSNPRQLIALLNHLLNPSSDAVPSHQETDFELSTRVRDAELLVG